MLRFETHLGITIAAPDRCYCCHTKQRKPQDITGIICFIPKPVRHLEQPGLRGTNFPVASSAHLDEAGCADAGEEELLLDALSVCGCALAALAAALAPDALLDAGLLPEEVSLESVVAPYKMRLRITRVSRTSAAAFLRAGPLLSWLYERRLLRTGVSS